MLAFGGQLIFALDHSLAIGGLLLFKLGVYGFVLGHLLVELGALLLELLFALLQFALQFFVYRLLLTKLFGPGIELLAKGVKLLAQRIELLAALAKLVVLCLELFIEAGGFRGVSGGSVGRFSGGKPAMFRGIGGELATKFFQLDLLGRQCFFAQLQLKPIGS